MINSIIPLVIRQYIQCPAHSWSEADRSLLSINYLSRVLVNRSNTQLTFGVRLKGYWFTVRVISE